MSYRRRNIDPSRNKGLSDRTPNFALNLIDRAIAIGDNAFSVNSVDALVYKRLEKGRTCSCLNFKSGNGTLYSTERDIGAPVIILNEDKDSDPTEELLDEVVEALRDSLEACPVCYGTGFIGGYKLLNSHETFLDTTYPITSKYKIGIRAGRPSFFTSTGNGAFVVFTINVPSIFNSLKVTVLPKSTGVHTETFSSMEIKRLVDPSYIPLSQASLTSLLTTTSTILIKIYITEDIHGIFIRTVLGETSVRINFPKIPESFADGAFDVWDTQTVAVTSKELLSNKDVLKDTRYNKTWRIINIERNEPREVDIGKDITLRRIKNFEVFGLLP